MVETKKPKDKPENGKTAKPDNNKKKHQHINAAKHDKL